MDQSFEAYDVELDLKREEMPLLGFHGVPKSRWAIEQSSPDSLILIGTLEGREWRVVTRARDLSDFAIVGGKFFWAF